MQEMTYAEALCSALCDALEKDQRVTMFNLSYGGLTPHRATFNAIRKRFPARLVQTPISELAYCGMAVGAAMTGLRPVVAVGTGAFAFEAWPQIVNEAAVISYGSGGRVSAPVVFHMVSGIRGAGGVQHSHPMQAMLAQAPGLQIIAPSTPADARGLMLTAALVSKNPTVYVDHQRLQGLKGMVDMAAGPIPFGVADVKRQGKDLTIVAFSVMVPRALEAAEILAREGISVEVVDPRTLVPLDKAAILASVAKTGRVVVADESQLTCGVASEIAAMIAEEGFRSLKAPPRRVGIPNSPIAYHQDEEDFLTPTTQRVLEAARLVLKG